MIKTQVLSATPEAIARAAELIRRGELVAFPTETVYGLGANALDARAVSGIFDAKGRPGDNPLIVHISDMRQVEPLIEGKMPELALRLARAFWPGALTMIFKKSALVPDSVSAGLQTVGVRMPSHPVARALIECSALPIAAPSANLSGRPSPTSARHVLSDLDGRIPLILDGGPCEVGLESTVLDVTCFPPKVLRPGGVTPEMIAEVAAEVQVDERVLAPLGEGEKPSSPGMKYRHYAPKGELSIVSGEEHKVARRICAMYDAAERAGKSACILALCGHLLRYGHRRAYDLGEDPQQAARSLFSALREMDAQGVDILLCEGFAADGIGLALMNRLARAAAFRLIDAGM